jgi:hypothetical protein
VRWEASSSAIGAPEERHDAVAGHLVHSPFEVVDLVDQDLVDLVHQGVGLFGAELLGQGREPGEVAEEDGYLALLAFDAVLLGEDLLGQSARRGAAELGDLVFRSEVFRGWFGFWRDAKFVATFEAELGL